MLGYAVALLIMGMMISTGCICGSLDNIAKAIRERKEP